MGKFLISDPGVSCFLPASMHASKIESNSVHKSGQKHRRKVSELKITFVSDPKAHSFSSLAFWDMFKGQSQYHIMSFLWPLFFKLDDFSVSLRKKRERERESLKRFWLSFLLTLGLMEVLNLSSCFLSHAIFPRAIVLAVVKILSYKFILMDHNSQQT